MEYRLNIYSRKTGEYITCIRGNNRKHILDQAVTFHSSDKWEWDGTNRPPRKD